MHWYMLKTWPGREEELIRRIHRMVPRSMYEDCFSINVERIWRKQQRSVLHIEPFLPGCVFLVCRTSVPLLLYMERIPALAGMMAGGEMTMLPLMQEDADFLMQIAGKEHLVRLSYIDKDPDGPVGKITGPLGVFGAQTVRYQFKKRYAAASHRLCGEDRTFVLGILLKEDREYDLREEPAGMAG